MHFTVGIRRDSGKTQRDFCREKDIAYSKFQYWLRRYKTHDLTTETSAGFVPVSVKSQVSGRTGALELVYPDGRRLIFHQDVDASFLRTLLA